MGVSAVEMAVANTVLSGILIGQGHACQLLHVSFTPFLCLDEYETLVECSEKLRVAVQNSLTSLSCHLLEKHLITPEHDNELRNGRTGEPERAARLVELVRHKVELDHENYYTFVSILEADSGYYNEILKFVKSKLEEKKIAKRGNI